MLEYVVNEWKIIIFNFVKTMVFIYFENRLFVYCNSLYCRENLYMRALENLKIKIISIIISLLFLLILILSFIILFKPKGEFSPYKTLELQGKDVVVDFYPFVETLDSIIIMVRDSKRKNLCDVRFNQVIDNYKYIMVTSESLEYAWLDINSHVQYNDRFLWCKSCNGRYIIIDYVSGHVFITFSYYQLKIGVAFLILIIIIIILLVKIKRLKRLQTK